MPPVMFLFQPCFGSVPRAYIQFSRCRKKKPQKHGSDFTHNIIVADDLRRKELGLVISGHDIDLVLLISDHHTETRRDS